MDSGGTLDGIPRDGMDDWRMLLWIMILMKTLPDINGHDNDNIKWIRKMTAMISPTTTNTQRHNGINTTILHQQQ